MNHTTQEPKSLYLAVELDYRREYEAAHELRTMQARIAELEARLYAISTVEVGQSIQPPVQADTEAPLRCDVCGVECANPWHFSTETKRHKHACDACWGRMKIPGQVGELDHTTAPQQEPLTEDQIAAAVGQCETDLKTEFLIEFARAIEEAHGITGGQQ